jgi:hypothetical protein
MTGSPMEVPKLLRNEKLNSLIFPLSTYPGLVNSGEDLLASFDAIHLKPNESHPRQTRFIQTQAHTAWGIQGGRRRPQAARPAGEPPPKHP